uniref:Protein kinase domain-containing protein n=1 Tax=Timema poppense TaxID=170557 RepID=A0A7R9GWG4_TIMPO|nr:unnamed protein product [Timema poppensis]
MKKEINKAYGIVWKAIDKRTKEVVAVKKIFDAFRNQTDAQRTFREIMFLREFGNHPNVVKLHNIYKASNNKDIYLPSNILIDAECRCKVADFGLARSVTMMANSSGESSDPALTDYVATRWYRAPEILIASKRYTKGIDMWSLGCILAEMLLGKPLFPGSSTINQIERIMSTIPPPTTEDVENVCTGYGSSLLQRAPAGPRRPLTELLKDSTPDALDLVTKLLVFHPHKRLTASEALMHPYVHRFHNSSNEPSLNHDVLPPLRDDVQLAVDDYRNKLYEMMSSGIFRFETFSSVVVVEIVEEVSLRWYDERCNEDVGVHETVEEARLGWYDERCNEDVGVHETVEEARLRWYDERCNEDSTLQFNLEHNLLLIET